MSKIFFKFCEIFHVKKLIFWTLKRSKFWISKIQIFRRISDSKKGSGCDLELGFGICTKGREILRFFWTGEKPVTVYKINCLIILFGIWIIQQFPSELGRSAGDIYVLLAISKSMVDHLVQNCCIIHESICWFEGAFHLRVSAMIVARVCSVVVEHLHDVAHLFVYFILCI